MHQPTLIASALLLAAPLCLAQQTATPESGVSRDRILQTIKDLPTKRSSWGDEAHEKGLRDTEKQLADKLRALGYEPKLDPVDFMGHRVHDTEDAKPQPYNNIIADLPGTSARSEVLILSAHLDAVFNAPGADDDGSGIAVLMEAARLLKGKPMQRSVRFILFNLEENGLVGSRAYTMRIKPDVDSGKEKIVGMVSMDMLGFYCDQEGCQKSPIQSIGNFKAPTVGDFIGMAGAARFAPFSRALDKAMHEAEPAVKTVVVDFLPLMPPDLLRSDHAPFLAINVPAVILADTANFRNPNYHKATDTIDTLDMDKLTIAARAIVGAMHRLAGPPDAKLIDLTPLGAPPAPPAAPSADAPRPDAPAAPKP